MSSTVRLALEDWVIWDTARAILSFPKVGRDRPSQPRDRSGLIHNLHDLRLTPRLLVVAGVIAALAVIGSAIAIRGTKPRVQVPPTAAGQANASSSSYAEESSCAGCHTELA